MSSISDLLKGFKLEKHRIVLNGEYSHKELLEVYDILSTAIMDYQVPFTKPIAFMDSRLVGKQLCPVQYQERYSMSPIEFGFKLGEIASYDCEGRYEGAGSTGRLRKDNVALEDSKGNSIHSTKGAYIKDSISDEELKNIGLIELKNNVDISREYMDGEESIRMLLQYHYSKDVNFELPPDKLIVAKYLANSIVPVSGDYLYWSHIQGGRRLPANKIPGLTKPQYVAPFHITNYNYSNSTSTILSILMYRGTGIRDYHDNRDLISNYYSNKVFPCRTVYDLGKYIKLWYPMDGGDFIKVTIKENVNLEILQKIIEEWSENL